MDTEVKFLVLPVGGGVVAVGAVDAAIGVTGVMFGITDVFAGAGKIAPGKDASFSVKLGALMRAGAGGWATVALSLVQLDGSDQILPDTRLTTASPAFTRAVSSQWADVTARGGIVSFRLVGRAATTAGDANLATVTLRVVLAG